MQAMERHRGHFYNWYDTQTLKPLLPLYISTVDSGNLAGHLLTLRAGLLALPDDKIARPRVFDGIEDTLAVLADIAGPGELRASDGSPRGPAFQPHWWQRASAWRNSRRVSTRRCPASLPARGAKQRRGRGRWSGNVTTP